MCILVYLVFKCDETKSSRFICHIIMDNDRGGDFAVGLEVLDQGRLVDEIRESADKNLVWNARAYDLPAA